MLPHLACGDLMLFREDTGAIHPPHIGSLMDDVLRLRGFALHSVGGVTACGIRPQVVV